MCAEQNLALKRVTSPVGLSNSSPPDTGDYSPAFPPKRSSSGRRNNNATFMVAVV